MGRFLVIRQFIVTLTDFICFSDVAIHFMKIEAPGCHLIHPSVISRFSGVEVYVN
jgi:hypothetical protein